MTPEQKKAFLEATKKIKQSAPVETQENSVPVTEAEGKPEEAQDPLKEQVPQEDPVVAQEQPVAEAPAADEGPLSWDEEEEVKPSKTESPKPDYTKLGSALGIDKVDSEDVIVEEVSKLKSKLKEYEEKPLAGVPEEFREVIEVARTGDWKEFMASQLINYNELDPKIEFENDWLARAAKNPKFFTDGKFDEQKAEEALTLISDYEKEVRGEQIIQFQAQRAAQIREQARQKAQAKLEKADKALSAATKDLNEIWDIKSYGLKPFESKHSIDLYKGIVSSEYTKKYLGGITYEDLVRSGADMKAIADVIAKAKYADLLIKNKGNTSKVEAKKELLSKMQNPQVKTTSSIPNPNDPEKKVENYVDKFKKHYATPQKGL